MKKTCTVSVFTDGALIPNSDRFGGWSAFIVYNYGNYDETVFKVLEGGTHNTTISRMELTGPVKALEFLVDYGFKGKIEVYSDSLFMVSRINNNHYKIWEMRNWISQSGRPICNRDLWTSLMKAKSRLSGNVNFHYIESFAGYRYNMYADRESKKALKIYQNYFKNNKFPADYIYGISDFGKDKETNWIYGYNEKGVNQNFDSENIDDQLKIN
jgi:ribonuclease HI